MVFQDRTYAVLLVSASDKFDTQMSRLLPGTDYYPVHSAKNVGQARRMLLDVSYDLVLINAPLPDENGTQLAIDVCSDTDAGVLLFVREEQLEDVAERVTEYGAATLPKPTASVLVSQTLRLLRAQRERLRRLEARQQSIEEKMEEIRLVNRAKWLLIERRGMTEEEAQHYIERQSMDQRISKRQTAENIIRSSV